MNEKLAELLMKYIDKASGFIEKAVDLAFDEVPKVIQEYLSWGLWDAVISLVIWSLVSIVIWFPIYLSIHCLNKKDEKGRSGWETDGSVWVGPLVIFAVFVAVVQLFILLPVVDSIRTIVKISVAPRVYLIEQASELYKSSKK